MLAGVIGVVVGALLAATEVDPVIVIGLVIEYVAIACALVGLVLLLWGLLRD